MNKIRINGTEQQYTELKFNPIMSYLSLKITITGHYIPESNYMIVEHQQSVYSGVKEIYHYDNKQEQTMFLIYIEKSKVAGNKE